MLLLVKKNKIGEFSGSDDIVLFQNLDKIGVFL